MTQFCIILSCILLISNSMISRAILEKPALVHDFFQIALEIMLLPIPIALVFNVMIGVKLSCITRVPIYGGKLVLLKMLVGVRIYDR